MTQIEQINLIWKRAPESAGHNKFYLVQLKDKPIIKDYADLPILATAQIREHMIVNSEWFREFDAELYVSLNIENSEWMSSLKEHEALSWVHRRINTFMAQWYNIEPLFCIEEVLKIDSYELCEAFDKERCRQRRRALSYNHTTNKWNELEKDKYE